MPRKRSTSGRARKTTLQSRIYLQAEKINKGIRRLERGKNFGKYKSKELIQFVNDNNLLSLSKNRGSKRKTLKIGNLKGASFGRLTLISKKFKEVLSSVTFTNVGIGKVRRKTRATLKGSLSGLLGRKVSDRDTDLFYEIIKYKSDYIISRIGPSEFYVLVMTARETNADVDEWVEMISNYVEINNEYMRGACEYLYNKFVK